MTSAYKCDRCGEFAEDWPALDFDIDTIAREHGGGVVLSDGAYAEWSQREETVELCPSCAVPAIEWMGEYLSGYNSTDPSSDSSDNQT